ncbi:MAG: sugar phosphate isomerase/epimerase [Ardenticatenaceae bacterium]|nr:sugar phosphate isomerase/epimerase [Ardenticatenaceae bacterium]
MKLGVFNPLFDGVPRDEMLDRLHDSGVQAVELRSGPNSIAEIERGVYPGQNHFDPKEALASPDYLDHVRRAFQSRGMIISALSAHGNPVHPDAGEARVYQEWFEASVRAAEKLGVGVVVLFSGCPGGQPGDRSPNWVTYTWPPDFAEALDYQWNQVLIPYWKEAAAFAATHGIKIAIEPHPGFSVYNTQTALKLCRAVNETIGVNFDPSHLFWQGIDPVQAIRALRGRIYHFHAKDTWIDPVNKMTNGVLQMQGDLVERTFFFRTVGYGHDDLMWKRIVSALRMNGYDDVLSIEHEDPLASRDEGLRRAIEFLHDVLLTEPVGETWWERPREESPVAGEQVGRIES